MTAATSPLPHRAGFSLMESVIAMAVLMTILMAVTQGINGAATMSETVTHKTELTNSAQSIVNQMAMDLRNADEQFIYKSLGTKFIWDMKVCTGFDSADGSPIFNQGLYGRIYTYDTADSSLTKEILSDDPAEESAHTLATNVKDFQIEQLSSSGSSVDGNRLRISLTLEQEDSRGTLYEDTGERVVFLRSTIFNEDTLSATGGGGSTPSTNDPPSVTITSPADGTTYGSTWPTITFYASASDTDGSVTQVEFLKDGTALGLDTDGSDGWSTTWTHVPGGTYQIHAVATDDAGDSSNSSSITITVPDSSSPPPGNDPPSTWIDSPDAGTVFTVGDTISITGKASDTDGTIAWTYVYINGTALGYEYGNTVTRAYTPSTAGTYTLKSLASDDDSAETTSTAVEITVVEPNSPPSVTLTSPGSGATYTEGDDIALAASASDSDGYVTQVEFFADGVSLGTDLDASDGWGLTWSGAAVGDYNVKAVATDDAGATTTSSVITVHVEAATAVADGSPEIAFGAAQNVNGGRKLVVVTIIPPSGTVHDTSQFDLSYTGNFQGQVTVKKGWEPGAGSLKQNEVSVEAKPKGSWSITVTAGTTSTDPSVAGGTTTGTQYY